MTKTKYFAIDANGTKHTRNSDRVYTHAVMIQDTYARCIANATDAAWDKTFKSNFKFYQQNEPAKVAAYADAAAYVAAVHAEMVAAVDQKKADGDFDKWGAASFNGRYELAAREAGKYQGKGWNVHVVKAEVEAAKPAKVAKPVAPAKETALDIIARMKAKRAA